MFSYTHIYTHINYITVKTSNISITQKVFCASLIFKINFLGITFIKKYIYIFDCTRS